MTPGHHAVGTVLQAGRWRVRCECGHESRGHSQTAADMLHEVHEIAHDENDQIEGK